VSGIGCKTPFEINAIDFEPGEDTFDRQVYKEYTQMGTKVKFLVWPALFLHKGGALISKGVLQPIHSM
jgi:hypothetical protein